MSVYKRKDSPYWQINFTFRGRKIQRSSGTASKEEAELIEARERQRLWDEAVHGKAPSITFFEASQRWVDEKADEKRTIARDIERMEFLCEALDEKPLESIERQDVIQALKPKGILKPATINIYLSIVISLQNAAFMDWKLTSEKSRIRRLPADNKINRWITPDEAERLIQALPERYHGPVRLSLLTGLRQMNVLRMRWEWLNLANRTVTIPAKYFKGKREFTTPLNQEAVELIRRQIGKDTVYVFGRMAAIGGNEHDVWTKALKEAGIDNFRWHDLRHTWASWHVQLGTSLQELMELGGWKSIEMVLRYAHLAPEQKHSAAERVVTKSLWSLNPENAEFAHSPYATKPSRY